MSVCVCVCVTEGEGGFVCGFEEGKTDHHLEGRVIYIYPFCK